LVSTVSLLALATFTVGRARLSVQATSPLLSLQTVTGAGRCIFCHRSVEYPEKVGDHKAYVLLGVRENQPTVKFYFDEKSGLLLRQILTLTLPSVKIPRRSITPITAPSTVPKFLSAARQPNPPPAPLFNSTKSNKTSTSTIHASSRRIGTRPAGPATEKSTDRAQLL
jgi:hypothetical protein